MRLTSFSPDGTLLAVVRHDGTLYLWDVRAGKQLREWKVPVAESRVISGRKVTKYPRLMIAELAFSQDGKVMFAAHESAVYRWEVATGNDLPRIDLPGKQWLCPRCLPSPDGRTVLVMDCPQLDMIYLLLDIATGKVIRQRTERGSRGPGHAFSPDGRTLAAVFGKEVVLWETATGRERGRLIPGADYLTAVAFSPDGRLLAAGAGYDSTIHLWRLGADRPAGQMYDPTFPIGSLVFSQDGKRLAAAGFGNTALVCDVAALLTEKAPAATPLAADDLNRLWAELTGADAARAFRAIHRLAASPTEAVPFLKTRMNVKPESEEKRIARLIADLDHDEFERREKASRELEGLGARTEPALRRTLEGKPSAEVRTRVRRLLDKLRPGGEPLPSPEVVALRILEALERANTAAARKAIEELAHGPADAPLTREARAALGRLAKRPGM